MLVTAVLGEFVAPPLERYAEQMKAFEKFRDYMAGNRGAWAKDGNTVVSFKQQTAGATYAGVYLFKFDAQRKLESVGIADRASIDASIIGSCRTTESRASTAIASLRAGQAIAIRYDAVG